MEMLSGGDILIRGLQEEGVDYVIDDPALEKDFYDQLSKAYNQKGNTTKAAEYAKKAQDLGTP